MLDSGEFELREYLDYARRAILFFLNCHQWDGINKSEVDGWLNNFSDLVYGQYYSIRLLSQILYYSESDLVHLLKEGIFNKILGYELLLKRQIPSNFQLSQQQLQYEIGEELKKTLFVPLLDADGPHESGNQLLRLLVQHQIINVNQSIFAKNISPTCNSYKRLIIVDDCIGSGEQCRTFWKKATINNGEPLRKWCSDKQIEVYYLVLVGYENTIISLTNEYTDLKIRCVEMLQDIHRIFDEKSIFWKSKDEMEDAKKLFSEITKERGIPIYGFNDMDFAVIIHRTIPDWCSPLFWKGINEWTILMRRKNSYE
jgi:hypothetical protein